MLMGSEVQEMAAQPSPLPKKQKRRQPVTSAPFTEEQIRQRAYEIYLRRGEVPGSEVDDWLQAELELRISPNE